MRLPKESERGAAKARVQGKGQSNQAAQQVVGSRPAKETRVDDLWVGSAIGAGG